MPGSGTAPATLHLSSDLGALARLYPWLDAEAPARHLAGAVLHAMHVALEEVVTNIALHAFTPGAPGTITITLDRHPGCASLIVEDTGVRFDPTTAPLPEKSASLHEAAPGGRGLILLRHYCRDITYERTAGRNRVTLRFPLAP